MQIIQLARNHVGNGAAMESSARLCLADAIKHSDNGQWHRANVHALKSLAYSVGIVHADYCKAWHAITGDDETRLPGWREFSDAIDADEKAL